MGAFILLLISITPWWVWPIVGAVAIALAGYLLVRRRRRKQTGNELSR